MKTKLSQLKKQDGFTIVEIMIVLAVAALIMLIVFLAVPALNRNSHNTQRKSDASHMASLVSEYASNNNGALPATIATGTGSSTTTLYLGRESFSILKTYAGNGAVPGSLPTTLNTLYYYYPAVCTNASGGGGGSIPTATGAPSTSAVLYYMDESSGNNVPQCTEVQ